MEAEALQLNLETQALHALKVRAHMHAHVRKFILQVATVVMTLFINSAAVIQSSTMMSHMQSWTDVALIVALR